MQKYNWFSGQKVSNTELQNGFEGAEDAQQNWALDNGVVGITSGGGVSQHAGTANLTVDITGATIYDQTGQRICWTSLQNVDCSVDENSNSTAVTTPGNGKKLSIFAKFKRVASDPRLDLEGTTVYFDQAESYEIHVAQGAEGTPPGTPPVLRSDEILLADITLVYGQTQILNADVVTTRRQWAIKTTSGTSVAVGTAEEAVQALATAHATADSQLLQAMIRLRSLNFRETRVVYATHAVVDIAVDEGNPRKYFAVCTDLSTVVCRASKDGCDHWTTAVTPSALEQVNSIMWDVDNAVWVALGSDTSNGVWLSTSTNPTSSWTSRTPTGLTSASDLARKMIRTKDPSTPRTIIFGKDASLTYDIAIYTTNYTSFTAATVPTGNTIASVDVNPTTNTLCAVGWVNASSNGLILRSTNNGSTWSDVTPTLAPVLQPGLQVIFDTVNACWWAIGSNVSSRLLKSTDDGSTWTVVTSASARDMYGIASGPNGEIVLNTSNGFAVSTDLGATWYWGSTGFGISNHGQLKRILGRIYAFPMWEGATATETAYVSLGAGELGAM